MGIQKDKEIERSRKHRKVEAIERWESRRDINMEKIGRDRKLL
jgi:hypothetical protein